MFGCQTLGELGEKKRVERFCSVVPPKGDDGEVDVMLKTKRLFLFVSFLIEIDGPEAWNLPIMMFSLIFKGY